MNRMNWLSGLFVVALCFTGCAESETEGTNNENNDNGEVGCVDNDGDGFFGRTPSCSNGTDCNDSSATANPNASEVCGDRRDNNCDGQLDEGCTGNNCIDNDGDRYGEGFDCFGPDCDDNNVDINPGETEIPGNDVDEDCKDGPLMINDTCTDADRDGYGTEGSTGCLQEGVDCDDNNADINPGATEVCDEADNNCADGIDECAGEGQVCDGPGGRCIGGVGAECENNNDCAGSLVNCDTSATPNICKAVEGGSCSGADDCFDGLTCEADKCTGNFCANNPCATAPYTICDRTAAQCVECAHFDPDPAVQDSTCSSPEQCAPGGWCVENWSLPNPLISDGDELLHINIALATCWREHVDSGTNDQCFAFFVSSNISNITENAAEVAYTSGSLDAYISQDEDAALKDIWGVGLFDVQDIEWNEDLVAGTAKEVCVWYQDMGLINAERMVLGKCTDFTP